MEKEEYRNESGFLVLIVLASFLGQGSVTWIRVKAIEIGPLDLLLAYESLRRILCSISRLLVKTRWEDARIPDLDEVAA